MADKAAHLKGFEEAKRQLYLEEGEETEWKGVTLEEPGNALFKKDDELHKRVVSVETSSS